MTSEKDTLALEIMSELKNYNYFVNSLMMRYIKNGPVLDFGSGHGIFCMHVNSTGLTSHGYEIDAEAIKKSKLNKIKTYNSLEMIPQLYPVVTSLNVLEHIENDEASLVDIAKLLQKDGLLILYLPASMKVWTQMDVDVGHFRRYEKKEIINKLTNNNFEIIHLSFKDFAGWLILFLFNKLNIKPKFNKKLLIFYDRFIFPISKYLDFIGSKYIGKNIFVVARIKN